MKVVMAGQGAFGQRHLEGIRNIPDIEVVSRGAAAEHDRVTRVVHARGDRRSDGARTHHRDARTHERQATGDFGTSRLGCRLYQRFGREFSCCAATPPVRCGPPTQAGRRRMAGRPVPGM